MLADLNMGDGRNLGTADGRIALDCSVRKTRQGHYVISTTDFFFPLVDSPYLQGRIGAANVLSDLYAEGVPDCDFVLMLVAACRDMEEEHRTICTREMMRGFRDACVEADTCITGGQTVLNPWPVIGGVATAIVAEGEFVHSDGALAGDVVVLTKPLGTQVAVNVHQWRKEGNPKWQSCLEFIDEERADFMMHAAVRSMTRLNRNASSLMLTHNAHAATDVTGFGILGHVQNLAENQRAEVGIELHSLPCIRGTRVINDGVLDFRLTSGYSAETSGGLCVCLSQQDALAFQRDLELLDGSPSWIIGVVTANPQRKAVIIDNPKILEI